MGKFIELQAEDGHQLAACRLDIAVAVGSYGRHIPDFVGETSPDTASPVTDGLIFMNKAPVWR